MQTYQMPTVENKSKYQSMIDKSDKIVIEYSSSGKFNMVYFHGRGVVQQRAINLNQHHLDLNGFSLLEQTEHADIYIRDHVIDLVTEHKNLLSQFFNSDQFDIDYTPGDDCTVVGTLYGCDVSDALILIDHGYKVCVTNGEVKWFSSDMQLATGMVRDKDLPGVTHMTLEQFRSYINSLIEEV